MGRPSPGCPPASGTNLLSELLTGSGAEVFGSGRICLEPLGLVAERQFDLGRRARGMKVGGAR
jgi:hypothetical protein